MFSTVSSMSISGFRSIVSVICSSRVSLNQLQSVFVLYNDGFFGFPSMWVNTVIRIGVSSDVNSRQDATASFLVSIPLVTQKSDGFGGLVVSMLASGTRVQTRPEAVGFFSVREKILNMPSFGGKVKESVPCPNFAACKRT
jgi:hypothetical protein